MPRSRTMSSIRATSSTFARGEGRRRESRDRRRRCRCRAPRSESRSCGSAARRRRRTRSSSRFGVATPRPVRCPGRNDERRQPSHHRPPAFAGTSFAGRRRCRCRPIALSRRNGRSSEYPRKSPRNSRDTSGRTEPHKAARFPQVAKSRGTGSPTVGSACLHRLARNCSRRTLPVRAFLCEVAVRERA